MADTDPPPPPLDRWIDRPVQHGSFLYEALMAIATVVAIVGILRYLHV